MMWNLHIWLVLFCSALSRAGGVEDPCLTMRWLGHLSRDRETHIWFLFQQVLHLDSWLSSAIVPRLVVSAPLTEVVP